MKGPISIAAHPLRPEIEAAVRATVHLCLVTEAERLHASTEAGFNPKAHRLRKAREIHQAWVAAEGGLIVCVWVWLSNEARYRAAWSIREADHGMKGAWERTEWPFKGKRTETTAKRRRRQSRGSRKGVDG